MSRDPDGPIISEVKRHKLEYKPESFTTTIPLTIAHKLGLTNTSHSLYGILDANLVWDIDCGKITVRLAK